MSETNGAPTTARRTTKRRSNHRFEIMNAFVDTTMADLTRSELAVWVILFRDTKPDGTARTAVDDIARRAGADRRTVLRALKSLEEKRKMIRVVRRGGLNKGPSTYQVFPYPME